MNSSTTQKILTISNFLKNETDITQLHAVDWVNFSLMIIGIFTNLLCIFIFSLKSSTKTKFNWYLLVLSVFELIFCFILGIDYFYRIISTSTGLGLTMFLHDLNIYTKIIMDFSAHTSDSYTIFLTLLLSIDRLYAISHPIKFKNFITNTHSKSLMLSSFTILCAIRLPSTIICHLCENYQACTIYCSFLLPIFLNILPAVIILILNVILIIKIVKYQMRKPSIKSIRGGTKKSNTSTDFNTKPITKLRKSRYFVIVTMAVWLLLTNIPYYALLAYQFGLNTYVMDFQTTFQIQLATSVLFNLNHCINFFIYFCFHDIFRTNFLKIFYICG